MGPAATLCADFQSSKFPDFQIAELAAGAALMLRAVRWGTLCRERPRQVLAPTFQEARMTRASALHAVVAVAAAWSLHHHARAQLPCRPVDCTNVPHLQPG